ncbi:hypothetical protein [Domibacillus robiginosus]|nr:hypothetical protein [Domibacillus robiginosus]
MMEQHPVVKMVFSDGRGQFADFFLSEVLAYRFGKEHHLMIKEVIPE